MGLLQTIRNRRDQANKAVIRTTRTFPLFGARLALLYFPGSVGKGFTTLSLADLKEASVRVSRLPGTSAGEQSSPDVYGIMVKQTAGAKTGAPVKEYALLEMASATEAEEAVARLADLIVPRRLSAWWLLPAAVAGLWLSAAGPGPAVSTPPQLSIYTPLASSRVTAAPGQAAALPTPGAPPAAQTSAVTPTPQSAGKESVDPFGIKFAPGS
ncbi:hypothetical protein ACSFA0_23805 [Variovorax sp. LT1P1]|uniref:hypothetical protein n=1 Tax=Variovorax sp. LT1P1 TaxID=3443730 RepID=UPI003F46C8A3